MVGVEEQYEGAVDVDVDADTDGDDDGSVVVTGGKGVVVNCGGGGDDDDGDAARVEDVVAMETSVDNVGLEELDGALNAGLVVCAACEMTLETIVDVLEETAGGLVE